jgi:hypothetical protein
MFGFGGKDKPGYEYTGTASPSKYHNGGKVKKGGKASVLKGEEVLTAKESKKYHKLKKVVGGNVSAKKSVKVKSGYKKVVAKKRS